MTGIFKVPVTFKEPMSLQTIIQTQLPGSQVVCTWPLTGGISAQMTAVETMLPDGRLQRYVLRTFSDGRSLQKEFTVMETANQAQLPVPRVLTFDDSGQMFETPYLLMEFVPGQMNFKPADLPSHMRQMAHSLAQIHQLAPSDQALDCLPKPAVDCATLGNLVEGLSGSEIEPLLPGLSEIPAAGNSTVLLHGDFWPGNLLWENGRLTAIIDWEDAIMGDPLIDLARSRSEISWIFGREALNTFTQHYLSLNPITTSSLPYWDRCALLRQLRMIAGDYQTFSDYFAAFGRSDLTAESIRQNLGDFGHNI